MGSDGLVYIAATAGYGIKGGAVAGLGPEKGEVVYNICGPFIDKPPYSLATDPKKKMIYAGCTAGADKEGAPVIAWDVEKKKILWEVVPVKETSYITSLNWVGGKLWGTAGQRDNYIEQDLIVLEPATGKLLSAERLPFGGPVYNNLRVGPDGWLYGLSGSHILFRINPETRAVEKISQVSGSAIIPFTVTQDGLYYEHEGKLMRYKFDKRLATLKE